MWPSLLSYPTPSPTTTVLVQTFLCALFMFLLCLYLGQLFAGSLAQGVYFAWVLCACVCGSFPWLF